MQTAETGVSPSGPGDDAPNQQLERDSILRRVSAQERTIVQLVVEKSKIGGASPKVCSLGIGAS
eukprot:43618-Pelagomonas_calceolata.AAC.2